MADGPEKDASGEQAKQPAFSGKRCFVIMPYGRKHDERDPQKREIDFEPVYTNVIKPAVHSLAIECVRSDEISRSGLIHKEMIEDILESDVVVVDITLLNPNVFYELGVRHAARRSGTVVVRSLNQPIPFNINGVRVFDYDASTPDKAKQSSDQLSKIIANSLAEQAVDSLVYSLTGSSMTIQRVGRPLDQRDVIDFSRSDLKARRFGIITGDICHVDTVDVWLNPENTRMQMGRWHDESVSSCIRYLGGRKNVMHRVTEDRIQDELEAKLGKNANVEAGNIVVTGSGQLSRTHGVKAIFHAAAMNGEPMKGYQLIRNYPICVTNALTAMDRLNTSVIDGLRFNPYRGKLKSILIPLLGSRERRTEPHEVAYKLILAATNYLRDHPDSAIKAVYFLAFTDVDLTLCETALHANQWI